MSSRAERGKTQPAARIVSPENDAAVVQRRAREEEGGEELGNEGGVQEGAVGAVDVEVDLPLNGDQGARARARKGGRHIHEGRDEGFRGGGVARKDAPVAGDGDQRLPDFRLENDEEGEGAVEEEVARHPGNHIELGHEGYDEEQDDDNDADGRQHLHAPRTPEEIQDVADGDRQEDDLENVENSIHASPLRREITL